MGEDKDRPFIDSPNELDDDPRNGLICFLNMDRQCGPDCMAYTTFGSEAPQLNEQQKHCTIIVSVERVARFSGGLLSIVRRTTADAKRAGGQAPPGPMGEG